ncbi:MULTISPECIES: sugar phosphate isomerase/epimerase family protein [unclassified Mesorhizobium]|uniref:sugar phosphate isomerase/epimerase family protein n=1 Tax=unclassified Mesorhizobium TaxID=325217 RepID=UPI001CCAB6B1|nr:MULTISPECIES: sugar phosphate isomerase/epimerase family protein [unclassified Mesorhizobium]MBZ9742141.1 sugar phosphate isomerase/epimerase [Mesorhizobium sp. CO1-1-4]MBZ9804782.1 sugar phosphate isomerase/epimerase [Mesorhizobium sp. ES1-6]
MTNVFGLHTFAIAPVWDLDLIEPQMERLKGLGIGLLEIPLLRPEEMDTARTRAFAERWNVALIPSLGLPASLDVVARPDEALAFLEPAFGVCEAVGSEALGGVTYGTIGKTSGRAPTAGEIDGMCRFLVRAAKAAGAHGLKLGIEPCNRYETHLINRGVDAADIIERVGADNIFIHLDTYHMHIEEESFAAGFKAAAPYLGYVHVSEANRGVPGRGMLDWAACMKAIADIGYTGAITLESMNHVDADIAGGLAVWRPVADNPDDVIGVGLPFLREAAAKAGLRLGAVR